MQEILNKRTISAKHFDNGDGTFTARTASRPVHYKNSGAWDEIDVTPEDKGTYWAFEKANHKLYLAKDFGAPQLIRFDNKTGEADQKIFFEPHSLVWVNKNNFSDSQVFRAAQSVQGVLNGNIVTYTDAFGAGLDYEVEFATGGIGKNLVINSLNSLEQPPTPQHKLVLLSKFQADGIKLRKRGENDWDKNSYIESEDEFEIADDKVFTYTDEFDVEQQIITESKDKAFFRKPAIWDTEDIKQPVKVFWTKRNGALWQGKVLPKQFLLNANYPVRTDTVIDTYDATNSKQIVQDNITTATSYQDVCNAAAGNNVYTLSIGTQNIVHDSLITNWYVRKADLQFDTSSIPAGSTVSALSLWMYSHSSGGADTDGFNLIGVDNTNNAGISDPVVAGDWDAIDDDSAAIATETFADYLNKTTNVEMVFTSFAVVDVGAGAVTRIGVQSENAALELRNNGATAPTGSNIIRIAMGTDAPYLEVTYTIAYDLTQSGELNGSSQYFSAADSASLDLTGNQTHEGFLWFDTTPSSGNGMCIFDKYNPVGNQRGISVVYENSGGTLRFLARISTAGTGGSTTSGTLNYTVTTGEWHHYRFVYSTAGTIQIYVDGSSVGTISSLGASVNSNSGLYKLGFNSEISGYFDGKISLWKVWNETHTDSDTCSVYGSGTALLQAQWTLDNELTDGSGNSNTLTNNGTATFPSSVPSTCSGGGANTSNFFQFM